MAEFEAASSIANSVFSNSLKKEEGREKGDPLIRTNCERIWGFCSFEVGIKTALVLRGGYEKIRMT